MAEEQDENAEEDTTVKEIEELGKWYEIDSIRDLRHDPVGE